MDSLSLRFALAGNDNINKDITMPVLDRITDAIVDRGDLAHVALFVWALGASTLSVLALREVASAHRRFDDFVRELAHFNRRQRRPR